MKNENIGTLMERFFERINMKTDLNEWIIKITGLKEYICDINLPILNLIYVQNQLKRLNPIYFRFLHRPKCMYQTEHSRRL